MDQMGQPNVNNAAPPGPGITIVQTPILLTSAWFAALPTSPAGVSPSTLYTPRRFGVRMKKILCFIALIFSSQIAFAQAYPSPITVPPSRCDQIALGGQTCVAAYSVTRRMFKEYQGPLFNITRASD